MTNWVIKDFKKSAALGWQTQVQSSPLCPCPQQPPDCGYFKPPVFSFSSQETYYKLLLFPQIAVNMQRKAFDK